MQKTLKTLKTLLSTISLALCSFSAFSQETESSVNDGWGYSANLATLSIDSDKAIEEGIEDNVISLGLYADYTQNNWITSLGMDVVFYDDNNEFSQQVVGDGLFNEGDRSTESSDAMGFLLSAASGYQWYFGEENKAALQLQGGFSAMVSSERSISNCSDCRSEDIDIDGGAFVRAKLLGTGESISYGLVLTQYVSGDLGTAIGFQIGFGF